MSIKGTTKELYIGKTGVNIITFMGNKISIDYSDMKRIDYCYASTLRSGYMNFILKSDTVEEFSFSASANDPIMRTVDFIKEHAPALKLEAHSADEKKKTLNITVNATFGYKELGLPSRVTISQAPNGNIYFNKDSAAYYSIVEYVWNGAEYETVTTGTTKEKSDSKTVKKGKSLKIGAGAILGNFIAPGVGGALVGAAMGAGSKGKSNTKGGKVSNTTQHSKNIEKDTLATLSFKSLDTEKIYKLSFKCNTLIDSQIRCLNIEPAKDYMVSDITQSLEGIKALKELLDMGIISQEEFDAKKDQILNI